MRSYISLPIIYFIMGAAWIALSDTAFNLLLAKNQGLLNLVQLYKGQLFIALTTFLLYLLLRRESRQRQKIETEAHSRDESFRYVFLNNPRPMWIYDLETLAFLDVNEVAEAQYGYSRAEFLSMTIKDIRPPEDVPRLLADIAADRPVLQRGGQWRHQHKDGTIIEVDISSHLLTFKGRRASLVVIQDITERNRIERELKQTNETLKTLIAASPLGIIVGDSEGRVTMWSPAAERIFGWSAAETIGQPAPFVQVDKRMFAQQIRRSVLEGETFTDLEIRRLHKSGELIDLSLSVAPLYNTEGIITGTISLFADISERKQLQREVMEKEQLRLALNKEIELRQLRERFTSMMSHEFRNPLTTIFTSTDMLDHYHDRMNPEARRQKFNDIRGQIRRLVEMLDDILTVMRSETIGLQFKPVPVAISGFVEGLVDEARMNDGENHNISFNSDCHNAIIEGDEKLLRHAVTNLLSNAIKYSPESKSIDVSVECTVEEVTIQVADQGIGIPEHDLKKLADAFFRASNVGAIPGTGLGLAITRQAVELHHGRLDITSQPGTGSTFSISLPLHDHQNGRLQSSGKVL